MGISRLTKYFTAWVACFAVLTALLAPLFSHAVAAASDNGSFSGEICSIHGTKLIKAANVQAPDSSSPAEKGWRFAQCLCCLTHAGAFGLPPAAAFMFPAASSSLEFPSLFYQSPRPLFVWATPQSRAPPAYS